MVIKAKHALVAFGGNLPWDGQSTAQLIQSAVESIARAGLILAGMSRLYATPCFPAGAGPDYVNAAARFTLPAGMTPSEVLAVLHDAENGLGRKRTARWAGRTLDADLLAVDDVVLPDVATQTFWRDLAPDRQMRETPDRLILPHPRLQDRAFVLVPLADVAPDWQHPVLGLTVRQMLSRLSGTDRDGVRAIA
jgi:2-amino-4-hydroxy-6-hydroxymethyldihydropteridine diphosphokinase